MVLKGTIGGCATSEEDQGKQPVLDVGESSVPRPRYYSYCITASASPRTMTELLDAPQIMKECLHIQSKLKLPQQHCVLKEKHLFFVSTSQVGSSLDRGQSSPFT